MANPVHRKRVLAALVVLLIGVSAFFSQQSRKAVPQAPMLDGTTMTIAEGIHLLGGLGPAAAYAIETSQGIVLIDSGLDSDARALKSEMEKLGLDWHKLKAIFLTHVHGDHCGGAQQLRAETGARVYAGRGDALVLEAGEPRDAFFSTFKMPDHSPHATTVDIVIEGGERICFGECRFQCLDTPGHTWGSTCYLLELAKRRVFFSGDVIYRLGEKPFGTYTTYLAPQYRGDAQMYLDSLRKLRAIRAPDLLLPGHPGASRIPQSPQLDQERWEGVLDAGIHEMERLVGRYRTDGANFLDQTPKQLLPGMDYLGEFQGESIYSFETDGRCFVVDAPGGPGLGDFLKQRWRGLGRSTVEPFAVLLTGCEDRETAGLKELVDLYDVQVVASSDCREKIQQRCSPTTTILSPEELKQHLWFDLNARYFTEGGRSYTVYILPWTNKTVLFSGRAPIVLAQSASEGQSLTRRQSAAATVAAIRLLGGLRPDVWLPANPVDSPNANLYGDEWSVIAEKNFWAANQILQRP